MSQENVELVQRRIEVGDTAIFLRQAAIPVVADAECQVQIWLDLVLILMI